MGSKSCWAVEGFDMYTMRITTAPSDRDRTMIRFLMVAYTFVPWKRGNTTSQR